MGLEHLTTLDAIKQLLDGTQIKVLAFEEGDYGLWSKRLEQGRFATLNCADDNKRTLSRMALLALIEGVDMMLKRRRQRYKNIENLERQSAEIKNPAASSGV